MNCAPALDMLRNSRSPRLSMNVTSLRSTTHVRPWRLRIRLLQFVLSSPIQGPTRQPWRIHRISVGLSLVVILNTSASDPLEGHAIVFQFQKRGVHVRVWLRVRRAGVRPCGMSTHQSQPSEFRRSDQPPHRSRDTRPSGRGGMRQPRLCSDRALGSRGCGRSEGTRPAHRSRSQITSSMRVEPRKAGVGAASLLIRLPRSFPHVDFAASAFEEDLVHVRSDQQDASSMLGLEILGRQRIGNRIGVKSSPLVLNDHEHS